ncbi:hypothetical protein A2Z22_03250 [Candidatus Woesebacteria bacterium RBG_16_34_12]|uniref:Uridine phosphorylase n=1 Tax=Candidatus Woesebacteria bacterium RBG_16_34_12 TaxID=1802480 RepID=A0A1F7XAN3_9BACT|nr:MAG: hypothetical protein A2Z22_03250 [Candidatus Woesebacteria bacterium RBG_16_34_12]
MVLVNMYTLLSKDNFRRHFELTKDYVVEGLLLSGAWDLGSTDNHLPYLRNTLDSLDVKYEIKKFEQINAGHLHEITIDNKYYWFVPVMGTAVMSIYAHIASILGSRKNILIGVVGGLAEGIKPGDFVLPKKVFGNDNALKYQPQNKDKFFYPDKKLYKKLLQRLPSGVKIWEGKTITCEVMLAESPGDVKQWSKENYLGVEMEAAMVFALSNHFKIPSAAIFSVSDNLIENETLLHESHQLSQSQRRKARSIQYDIAIRELLDMPAYNL